MKFNEVKLGDIISNLNSKRIPLSSAERSKMQERVYPYYGAQGIIDYVDNFIFNGEYLLVAEDGENLKSRKKDIAQIAKGKFWVNNHAHIINETDQSNIYFLKELLNRMDLSGYITGSAQPKLNKQNLEQIRIQVPPKEMQDTIGSFIRSCDEKFEANNASIRKLEELAQILFNHWFEDFEFPDAEGRPYKSSGRKMVESELGEIPEGWEITSLKQVANYSNASFNPQNTDIEEVNHFSMPAFDEKAYPIIDKVSEIKSNKYMLEELSVLFSKMNPTTPRVWLPNIDKELLNVCSTEFVVLNNQDVSTRSFVYEVCKSNTFIDYLVSNSAGSTNSRQRVRPTVATDYKFAYKKETATEFGDTVAPIHEKILALREENDRLTELCNTLLPKLLSGEIKIPQDGEVTVHEPV